MVEFSVLILFLALSAYIVMQTISVYNKEKIRKEQYELEKEKPEKPEANVSKVLDEAVKKEEKEKQSEFVSPFSLAQDILSGKKDIDEELSDDKQ